MFLGIITSTMPLLNEYYPEYTLRYSLETTMLIDSPFYNIEHQNNNLHLYSFQYLQMVNLTRSIRWLKYNALLRKLNYSNYRFLLQILIEIQILIILLLFPIWFATCHILLKYHFIIKIDLYDYEYDTHVEWYLNILFLLSKTTLSSPLTTTPTITFMNPYIKFVNYPQDYNWFLELIKPQSSPFVKTISGDIYK